MIPRWIEDRFPEIAELRTENYRANTLLRDLWLLLKDPLNPEEARIAAFRMIDNYFRGKK